MTTTVLPAQAGVSPSDALDAYLDGRAPRASGGESPRQKPPRRVQMCSPRKRG